MVGGLGFPLLDRSARDPANIEAVVGVEGAEVVIAFVQAPGHRLEFIHCLKPDERGSTAELRPCDTGFSHLAFDVSDIGRALEVAERYGFHPVRTPVPVLAGPNAGRCVVYTRDHNGMTIELIGPAGPA